MRILIPIKSIQDPAGLTVNRKAGRVFVNREARRMNPASQCALEAALRLKDLTSAEIIAVALGAAQDADVLRDAVALGANRAILVETGTVDSAGVVRAIAALIAHVGGVDLIINGHRTLDTGLSSGAGLAETLGWPYLGEAVDVALDHDRVRIARQVDPHHQRYEGWAAGLPAVVTVTPQGPAPRYAHGGDIIIAYRNPSAVERLTPADLGLAGADLASRTELRGQSFPAEREFGRPMTVSEAAALIGRQEK